ncbi:hypothetical protein E2C01_076839 [Portunus trituberculatus]|uniref:Uncharacterized protein n=1 Tax=Portunus trituberculatus TaxID=210409 RepID=A0A5B7I9S7_PORTR|nr:hypothetical protein [Portunus trituberculatus]
MNDIRTGHITNRSDKDEGIRQQPARGSHDGPGRLGGRPGPRHYPTQRWERDEAAREEHPATQPPQPVSQPPQPTTSANQA